MPAIVKGTQGAVSGSIGMYGISEPIVPTEPPVWATVPDGSALAGTTHTINMHQWVTGSGLGNWSLTGNPEGVTIDLVGVVHIPNTIAAQVMTMTCTVENVVDAATSNTFVWELTEVHIPEPPEWEVVPPQETDVTDLPASLDMTDYVTSFLPITGWDTNEGVINAAGLLTIPEGTDIQTLVIIITATNDDGSSDSEPFNWDITEEAPEWDTVPDLEAEVGNEYHVDMNTWVTGTNLTDWELTDNPTGVTIDTAGIVHIADTVPESSMSMSCTVSTTAGSATSNTFTWELTSVPLQPPIWTDDPEDQITQEADLPGVYDVSDLVFSLLNVTWDITAPATINANGVINITAAPDDYELVITASNDDGSTDSTVFTWTIVEIVLTPPEWDIVPPQSTDFNDLPADLLMNTFVTSDLPITDWDTDVGTIESTGVLTIPAGTDVQTLVITVTATNEDGSTDSAPFDWDITQEAPVWDMVPNLDAQVGEEYQIPMTNWVTGDDLTGWILTDNPTGVTIDTAGLVTIEDSVPESSLNMTCTVENQGGAATSNTFTWELTAVPLQPPIWIEDPVDQTTDEEDLPGAYDVSDLVFSLLPVRWEVTAPGTVTDEGIININTDPGDYPLVVTAINDDGQTDAPSFNWEIVETPPDLEPPVWDTDIPDFEASNIELPGAFDASELVTSDLPLFGWALSGNPTGVTIDEDGVINATIATEIGEHTLSCYVENDDGGATSNLFDLVITDSGFILYFYDDFNGPDGPLDGYNNWEVFNASTPTASLIDSAVGIEDGTVSDGTWDIQPLADVMPESYAVEAIIRELPGGLLNFIGIGGYTHLNGPLNSNNVAVYVSRDILAWRIWIDSDLVSGPTDIEHDGVDGSLLRVEFAPSEVRIFMDGVLKDTITETLPNPIGSPSVHVIQNVALQGSGAIEDVRVMSIPEEEPPPAEGLVLQYGFDEGSGTTALDTSGNDNHGEINNGSYTDDTPDGSDYSLALDSTYVRPDSDIDLTGEALTLCCWVKNAAGGAADGRYLTRSVGGSVEEHDWMFSKVDGTNLRSRIKLNGSVDTLIPGTGGWLVVGEWVHIALVYNGSSITMYANGETIQSWPATGTIAHTPGYVVDIGGQSTNSGFPSGQIDDARIYGEALTTTELLEIYVGQRGEVFNLTIADVTFDRYPSVDNYGLNQDSESETGVIVPGEFIPNNTHVINAFILSDEGSGKRINVRFTPPSLGILFQSITIGFPDSGLDNLSLSLGAEFAGYYGGRNMEEHYDYFAANDDNTIPIILYYQGEPFA